MRANGWKKHAAIYTCLTCHTYAAVPSALAIWFPVTGLSFPQCFTPVNGLLPVASLRFNKNKYGGKIKIKNHAPETLLSIFDF